MPIKITNIQSHAQLLKLKEAKSPLHVSTSLATMPMDVTNIQSPIAQAQRSKVLLANMHGLHVACHDL